MTNNPNSSLLWRFTVWKQYFSRQIVCIHATHTHTHTRTQHTQHTHDHIRMREFVKIDFEGKRKECIHAISLNIYFFVSFHIFAEEIDHRFFRFVCFSEKNIWFLSFLFFSFFSFFLPVYLETAWNFKNDWKLRRNLLHTWECLICSRRENSFELKMSFNPLTRKEMYKRFSTGRPT